MSRENKTCWERGMIQPLGMAIGSAINLTGAITSLIISSNSDKVNPLPFICCAMFTSFLYVTSNGYRALQIYKHQEPTELTEVKVDNFVGKVEAERKEKLTNSHNLGR